VTGFGRLTTGRMARSPLVGLDSLVTFAVASSEQADASAQLVPEVQTALANSGFARHFVPTEYGGSAGTFVDCLRGVQRLSAVCASTGWLASLFASVPRIAARLPSQGQREVWSDGPDSILAGSLVPAGRARSVPGGHRLSGTWMFVSGIELARWVLLMAKVDNEGGSTPTAKVFAVPIECATIIIDWHALGMRATGSHSVCVDDVLVPDHLSIDREALDTSVVRGEPTARNKTVTGLFFAGPMLGAGRGCLDSWSGEIGQRLRSAGRFASNTERLMCQETLARAAGELDQAELLLLRIADDADSRPTDTTANARGPRDSALAAELVRTATQRVAVIAGTNTFSTQSTVQRFFRDVTTIASHGTLRFVTKAEGYAQTVWPDEALPQTQ